MTESKSTASHGVSFGGLLCIAFIVLKLCHVIAWSWWWILCPVWIPLGLALLFFLGAAVLLFVMLILKPSKGTGRD